MTFLDDLSLSVPIIQAPMAGVSTPAMAAAVSEAGALGSLGLGASTPDAARAAILETRALTGRPFNVNVFCHAPAERDTSVEQRWIDRSRPLLAKFGATPPTAIHEIYRSFRDDDEMLAVLLETRPAVVSFHFGLPRADQIAARARWASGFSDVLPRRQRQVRLMPPGWMPLSRRDGQQAGIVAFSTLTRPTPSFQPRS